MTIRTRLLLSVLGAVAIALVAIVAVFNVVLDQSVARDANQVLHARAAATLGLVRVHGTRLAIVETPDDAAVDNPAWVFAGTRILEAPVMGGRLARAARSLATGPARSLDIAHTRLFSQPIVSEERRLGTVVAAVSLSPYDQTKRDALTASLVLGVLLLIVVAIAARWLLAASLRPVATMTRQAAAWSEHDLDRRFAAGSPRDEVTELASTLDGLLERLAASFRREQQFSAEISHELRTPISRVIAQVELALRRERSSAEYRETLQGVHRNAQQLVRVLDTLVAAARHDAAPRRGTADAWQIAEHTLEAARGLAAERQIDVVATQPTTPLRVGIAADLAERILQPVVENAFRYGRRSVRVDVERNAGSVRYVVEDDGPGIEPAEAESIFEPGRRGTAGRSANGDGAGLGLALARRLARGVAGDVVVATSERGARLVVSLPAA
ncbi:MAG TPA: ATP-binding protein [Gaiellaceae bacterium]|nr:ATP-binding protein [Gaiellaceae bacterium]